MHNELIIFIKMAAAFLYHHLQLFFFCFQMLMQLVYTYNSDNPYYQVMDQYSFNLKNKNDSSSFTNNFHREGDIVLYDKFIKMTPKKNNTFGFFYTAGQIFTENIEVQMKIKIKNEKGVGSALGLWFFMDDILEGGDRSFLGFMPKFKGVGVVMITPPKHYIEGKTFIFLKENAGEESFNETGFKKIGGWDSCNEVFNGRFTRLTITVSENKITISNDSEDSLFKYCMSNRAIVNLKPPFRIGLSAINGIVDGENYLDDCEIEKFTVFNLDQKHRLNYTKLDEAKQNSQENITRNADLVEYYQSFKSEKVSFTDLNSKLDNSIVLLSEISSSLKQYDKESEYPNLDQSIQKYTQLIKEFQSKVISLQEKLMSMTSYRNLTSINELFSQLNFKFLVRELEKMKIEWEQNQLRNSLSNQLNELLTQRVDNLVDSLKTTQDMHDQLANKLVKLIYKLY